MKNIIIDSDHHVPDDFDWKQIPEGSSYNDWKHNGQGKYPFYMQRSLHRFQTDEIQCTRLNEAIQELQASAYWACQDGYTEHRLTNGGESFSKQGLSSWMDFYINPTLKTAIQERTGETYTFAYRVRFEKDDRFINLYCIEFSEALKQARQLFPKWQIFHVQSKRVLAQSKALEDSVIEAKAAGS